MTKIMGEKKKKRVGTGPSTTIDGVGERYLSEELNARNFVYGFQDLFVDYEEGQPASWETEGETDDENSEATSSSSSASKISHNREINFLLTHLLRKACASKAPLRDDLTGVAAELVNLGIVEAEVADLAKKSSPEFDKALKKTFGDRMAADSKMAHFWKTASCSKGQCTSPILGSRYLNDFEHTKYIGRGSFGRVALCTNKVDGREYAVKKIRLQDEPMEEERILREVVMLSKLQHQNIVRYYQAWFDTGEPTWSSDSSGGSSFSLSNKDDDYKMGRCLHIQMEYCPRTLKDMLKPSSQCAFDEKLAWHIFRQIVEGLAHIHSQGIIHRDLTPNNIFFDYHGDIKIGDFGLAKFLKLEQLENLDSAETTGLSPSSQIGTPFYTAPEIRGRCLHIDEKADIYSLGIVFLELWYPFSTSFERIVVLSALTDKGELPSEWAAKFPEQALLLRRMTSTEPSDRPSATEVLQHAIPPTLQGLSC